MNSHLQADNQEIGDTVHLETNGLRIGGVNPCQSLKAGKPGTLMLLLEGRRRWRSQLKQREQICPSSAFSFYLGPQRIG